ncbi:MAG: bifunctional precorrin-2 dehydrogenase/sirohydrochlorin ferrochelatase, partial [Ginsengibacter sp.]
MATISPTLEIITSPETTSENNLFPIFLKLENLSLLIIGGGHVALEKLNTVLNNSPKTRIRLVAIQISDSIRQLAQCKENIELIERLYMAEDLDNADIVIAAVDDINVSRQIKEDAVQKGKLINAADKPDLCDFYLGSIVKKGNLKIAISTNGKSPTIAKRMKEVINTLIPDEMENVLDNMQTIRNGIDGNFDDKEKQLNDITKVLIAKQTTLLPPSSPHARKWQSIVKWSLLAFLFMILGHTILSYIPFESVVEETKEIIAIVDKKAFLMMLLCG